MYNQNLLSGTIQRGNNSYINSNNYQKQELLIGASIKDVNVNELLVSLKEKQVVKKPLFYFDENNNQITVENKFITCYKDDINNPFGVVSNQYKIFQNSSIINMLENIRELMPEMKYHGMNFFGEKFSISMKLPKHFINGEEISYYFVITNNHGGKQSLMGCLTPFRMACFNMLNIAFKQADVKWSIRHSAKGEIKITEIEKQLKNIKTYTNESIELLEDLNTKKINTIDRKSFFENIIDVEYEMVNNENETQLEIYDEKKAEQRRKKMEKRNSAIELINDIHDNKPDLLKLDNTGYKAINAVADYITHSKGKETKNWKQKKFYKLTENNTLLNKAYEMASLAF